MTAKKQAGLSKAAIKRKADKAEGKPVEDERPTSLDPALGSGEADTVERHPSGRPLVRYGPPPSYPDNLEAEQELFDSIYSCALDGYSLFATCKIISIPYSTIRSWAAKDYGVKLRECLKVCEDVRRGALEEKAIDGLTNKDFNNGLFKLMMGAMFPADYRQSLPRDGLPDPNVAIPAGNEFEAMRRITSLLDRHVAIKKGEIVLLPSDAPKAREG